MPELMKYDKSLLLTITALTIAGLTAATLLFLFGPIEGTGPMVATLFAFLGPTLSVLLLVLRNQVSLERHLNGAQDKLVSNAERIARLEVMVQRQGIPGPASGGAIPPGPSSLPPGPPEPPI